MSRLTTISTYIRNGVRSVGAKAVGPKSKNVSAEKLHQKAENQRAENTIRLFLTNLGYSFNFTGVYIVGSRGASQLGGSLMGIPPG